MSPSRIVSDSALDGPPVTTFRGRRLPTEAYLAGYSALIAAFGLDIPLPHKLSGVSPRNSRRKEDGWTIFPVASRPASRVVEHLVFALKNEGVELLALNKLFEQIDPEALVLAALAKPTSAYIRRLCFFYEFLTRRRLRLANTVAGAYVDAVDTDQQYGTRDYAPVKRFRVRDNLPGLASFCPLVYRTRLIDQYIEQDIAKQARLIVASAPKALIARAAAFLLLSDSKASFAIEGEKPPRDRIARWGAVIGKAGQLKLGTDQLIVLQRELIGDDRFVKVGLRDEGGFVGRHDSFSQPEPEHISANAQDLDSLLEGLVAFDENASVFDYHPVLTAASVAFGFVYIHPFEDGNGRIHRFLMHHVLAERGFTPPEIVLPISSVILDDIPGYQHVLKQTSKPLLDVIDWTATEKGNVSVKTDSADLYRYFDATAHCEYLFKCVARVVEKDLPEELAFLEHRDVFHRKVTEIVDMGERTLDLLLRFLRQGHGALSGRARTEEFKALSDREAKTVELIYRDIFER